jgi:hypothetical protein
MADFRHIDPGWYFVVDSKIGIYVCEKLDGTSLPSELQGGIGSESSIRIPKGANGEDYSRAAHHYGHFNAKVLAAKEGIDFCYDFFYSGENVDAFAARGLDDVISELMDKDDSLIIIKR